MFLILLYHMKACKFIFNVFALNQLESMFHGCPYQFIDNGLRQDCVKFPMYHFQILASVFVEDNVPFFLSQFTLANPNKRLIDNMPFFFLNQFLLHQGEEQTLSIHLKKRDRSKHIFALFFSHLLLKYIRFITNG